ncbi:inactive beta-amylase 9 [Salvia miltiorrhiza]|uniref:inactive beta-amylase 9 n=1 Tax=Salvia miltiorrhiza TaxID=226208 RepID=UPI0025AB9EAB|nr:inactive beta-amylase 9 [Salvia miltiorrhiza]
MEVSVIGSSQLNLGRIDTVGLCNLRRNLNVNMLSFKNNFSKGCNIVQSRRFLWPSRSQVLSLRASSSAQNQPLVYEKKASNITTNTTIDGTKLYVGLPLDTVSSCNSINHARAIAAGLKALKLLGVDGVELPVWWGVAENEAMGKYDWSSYLAIVEVVKSLDLELHVSLCFHASGDAKLPLPAWVSRIGESDPSIYFTDKSGQQYKDCLSLGVDDLPVLDGKTPLQVYKAFLESFKASFSPFMGSTITGLTIGLGPDGELRYPSHHQRAMGTSSLVGAGEFQCYDVNMLSLLKHHAEAHGNPLWGFGGPHDAPGYNESPEVGGFFADNGGAWENQYGDFFLSWYSNQLLSHGDRILALAASTFKDDPITLSGKIPLMHPWSKLRSHPSELTAGFYNTAGRDGYDAVAEMFSRNSCQVILPGFDLSDESQPNESRSSPESLLAAMQAACRKHETAVLGQNALVCGAPRSFEQISKNLTGENAVASLFTYQRMGADFFSPEHFPRFTKFVCGLNEPARSLDDLPVEEDDETAESLSGMNKQMQTA